MTLVCTACNYKLNKDIVLERCPYCGASGTMRKTSELYDQIFKEETGKKPFTYEKK